MTGIIFGTVISSEQIAKNKINTRSQGAEERELRKKALRTCSLPKGLQGWALHGRLGYLLKEVF